MFTIKRFLKNTSTSNNNSNTPQRKLYINIQLLAIMFLSKMFMIILKIDCNFIE